MTTGYRVLTYWTNQGEDLAYTIVQPVHGAAEGRHPLIHFDRSENRLSVTVPTMGFSLDALKTQLRAMLEACDLPLLHLEPEKVIPAKVRERSDGDGEREA